MKAKSDVKFRPFTKEDLLLVIRSDTQKKYEIEKSCCYIGYKLLWII
jgi:hypothetical protein